jgi:hypothetical protein
MLNDHSYQKTVLSRKRAKEHVITEVMEHQVSPKLFNQALSANNVLKFR